MRDERHFAEPCGTFIRGNQAAERILALFRRHFDDAATLEAYADAVDERALVGEGLRRAHDAIHHVLVGRGEDFLRRYVGVAEHAVQRHAAAALPEVILREAQHEVDSGAGILERPVTPLVQEVGAAAQVCVVRFPHCDRVRLVGLGAREDGLPEPVQCFLCRQIRKDGFCPGGRCRRDHAPVDGKSGDEFQCGPVGARACLVRPRKPFRSLAGEQGRVLACDGQPCGPALECLRHAVEQPVWSRIEGCLRGMEVACKRRLVVGIDRGHQACPCAIGVFGDAANQRHGVEGRRDQQLLTALDVEAGLDGQPGIGIEEFLMCHDG